MFAQLDLMKVKAASSGAFAHPARLFWFVAAAVIAPFALLMLGGAASNNLPWYFWTVIPLLILVFIGVGFGMFVHESSHAEDISIRPKQN